MHRRAFLGAALVAAGALVPRMAGAQAPFTVTRAQTPGPF